MFLGSILYLKGLTVLSTVPTRSTDLARSFYIGNK